MRGTILNPPSGYYNSPQNRYKKATLLIILILLVLVTLKPLDRLHLHGSFPFLSRSPPDVSTDTESSPYHKANPSDPIRVVSSRPKCNLFRGSWVPYPKGPMYNNTSGCFIEDGRNCVKYGRPDTEFTKWRWKPDACELPLFDPAKFLHLVRGKSMAFVGDSLARNHLVSLQCMLSSVALPVNESSKTDQRLWRWHYPDYNFTAQLFSTTHLVKSRNADAPSMVPIDVYLDKADDIWASQIEDFDYVIISAGHWFSRPLMYYEKGKLVGCNMCHSSNTTDFTRYYGYRKALETTFKTLVDKQNFKGMIILRTITAAHFEAEEWEGRGYCVRRRPFSKQEAKYDWYLQMFRKIQEEVFWAAEREGRRERGLEYKMLDITEAMWLRPDGHPNHYGHGPGVKKNSADCLHWCLPGPVDTWNELLLQILRPEGGKGTVLE